MLKIKMARTGKRGYATFRIVVNEARSKRNGAIVESLGYYDPHTQPVTVKLDRQRLDYWLGHGAQPTATVKRLIDHA